MAGSVATADRLAVWRSDPLAFFRDVLTLEDGRSFGVALDGWQREDFEALASSTCNAYVSRPRAHSKTADLAAFALHHLLTTLGARVYVFAFDRGQAALVRESVAGFVRRSELLQRTLVVDRWRIVAPSTDASMEIMPADAGGSWGLRPSLVIADELGQWRSDGHREVWQAIVSALGKVKGARVLVSTTAHWDRTGLCWQVRELAQSSGDWLFSERGQCATWIAPAFLEQQRALLPAHVYEMLHENRWTEAGGEFLTWAEVDGVFDPALPLEVEGAARYMGIDLGVARDRTAVALVRVDGDIVVVERLALWQGTPKARVALEEVEETVAELAERHQPREIALDPHQGLLMAERLRGRGLCVKEYAFTSPSRAALFDTLLQLIRQGRLKSRPHDVLREELAGLRWVERGGVLRPDHPVSGHDDAAVAVALASHAAVALRRRSIVGYGGDFWASDGEEPERVSGDPQGDVIVWSGGQRTW